MIVAMYLLTNGLALVTIVFLIVQFRAFMRTTVPFYRTSCLDGDLTASFRHFLKHNLNLETFLESSTAELLDCSLKYRDPDDSYETIEEALTWILQHPKPSNLNQVKRQIKAFYQIQYTLETPLETVKPPLRYLSGEIERLAVTPPQEIKVCFISSGQLIDLKIMQPANDGSIVRQPLGVAIVSGNTVLSKARVICV